MSNQKRITSIRKNQREAIVIALDVFKDMDLVDLRVHAVQSDQSIPTPKGITFRVEILREVIAGLQAAEAEARRQGLIQ